MKRIVGPLYYRLWAKIKKAGPDECWEWQGYRTQFGHGQIGSVNKSILLTHRATWEFCFGKIPEGMCVCHKCDNPPCCNPGHLFLGTHKQNMQDCHTKKRSVHFVAPDSFPTGERSSRAKLKKPEVLSAMEMVRQGIPARIIALKFGVSRSAISKIANGKSWRKELLTQ